MLDRRAYLRLEKNLQSTIYQNGKEYTATILDISQEGISFTIDERATIYEGDSVHITVCDKYENIIGDKSLFCENISAHVKDITPYGEGTVRCGCIIRDDRYTKYVQEQYIMVACGIGRGNDNG